MTTGRNVSGRDEFFMRLDALVEIGCRRWQAEEHQWSEGSGEPLRRDHFLENVLQGSSRVFWRAARDGRLAPDKVGIKTKEAFDVFCNLLSPYIKEREKLFSLVDFFDNVYWDIERGWLEAHAEEKKTKKYFEGITNGKTPRKVLDAISEAQQIWRRYEHSLIESNKHAQLCADGFMYCDKILDCIASSGLDAFEPNHVNYFIPVIMSVENQLMSCADQKSGILWSKMKHTLFALNIDFSILSVMSTENALSRFRGQWRRPPGEMLLDAVSTYAAFGFNRMVTLQKEGGSFEGELMVIALQEGLLARRWLFETGLNELSPEEKAQWCATLVTRNVVGPPGKEEELVQLGSAIATFIEMPVVFLNEEADCSAKGGVIYYAEDGAAFAQMLAEIDLQSKVPDFESAAAHLLHGRRILASATNMLAWSDWYSSCARFMHLRGNQAGEMLAWSKAALASERAGALARKGAENDAARDRALSALKANGTKSSEHEVALIDILLKPELG